MAKIKEVISSKRSQYLVFGGLCVGVLALTAIGYLSDNRLFQRFLGRMNPLAIVLFVCFLGLVFLLLLLSRGWFSIFKKEGWKGILRWYGLAGFFGLIAILVDVKAVFPADQNVLFPGSLVFYPVMGFLVEIVFHVMPIAILVVILTSIFNNGNRTIWVSILVVSTFEAILQVILGFSGPVPSWAYGWTGLQVYLINLSELIIFKRYGFAPMYSFRLVYYLIWHIAWGYFRLHILF